MYLETISFLENPSLSLSLSLSFHPFSNYKCIEARFKGIELHFRVTHQSAEKFTLCRAVLTSREKEKETEIEIETETEREREKRERESTAQHTQCAAISSLNLIPRDGGPAAVLVIKGIPLCFNNILARRCTYFAVNRSGFRVNSCAHFRVWPRVVALIFSRASSRHNLEATRKIVIKDGGDLTSERLCYVVIQFGKNSFSRIIFFLPYFSSSFKDFFFFFFWLGFFVILELLGVSSFSISIK